MFSCKKQNIKESTYSSDILMTLIDSEINLLKKYKDYGEYFIVIQSKDLLYVLNESSVEGLDLYYKELGCYLNNEQRVYF